MPRIPGSISDLSADHRPITLIVIAFDHVAIGIGLGNNRAKGVSVIGQRLAVLLDNSRCCLTTCLMPSSGK